MKCKPALFPLWFLWTVQVAAGAHLGDVRCYRCHEDHPQQFSRITVHDRVAGGDGHGCWGPHAAAPAMAKPSSN